MTRCVCRPSGWLVWFVLIWVNLCRIGEATVPGPCGLAHGGAEEVLWCGPNQDGLLLAACNPGGVCNKIDQFQRVPDGWYSVSETQTTASQQSFFRAAMKRRQNNLSGFRIAVGSPAPARPGSSEAGAWTGVLQAAPFPLRSVTLPLPAGIWESGRILVTAAKCGLNFVHHATIYCPPRGPTYPKAKELSEALLKPLTEELVVGRRGPRIISGDFNSAPLSLEAMKLWKEAGWVEAQDLFRSRGMWDPVPTCKNATRPDQVWLSPEIAPWVVNVGVGDWFPDHKALLLRINFPTKLQVESHWQMPVRLPWQDIDAEALDLKCAQLQPLSSHMPTTEALKTWCKAFEKVVSESTKDPSTFAPAMFGRCANVKPRVRPATMFVPKTSRPGEAAIASGFLNRSAQLWFQQRRRFQALRASFAKGRFDPQVCLHRQQLWNSICSAKGFGGKFRKWWPHRPNQSQGSPTQLSLQLPRLEEFQLVYEDFVDNYQKFESWNVRQRAKVITAKAQELHDKCFEVVRKDPKRPIEVLVDSIKQPIQVEDSMQSLVSVPLDFPAQGVIEWKLNGVPAVVSPVSNKLRIDTDLVLCSGQQLEAKVLVSEVSQIHDRLESLWSERWQKHADCEPNKWDRILKFAKAYLGRSAFDLPPLSYEAWISAVKNMKVKSARGPEGFSREDLLRMPRSAAMNLVEMFHDIEQGREWPAQMLTALIHCQEKKQHAEVAGDFRPITLFATSYRIWASVRSRQMLQKLSSYADSGQFGYMRERNCQDIWYLLQMEIEEAVTQSTPLSGAVADLVKAFNLLPRVPTFAALSCLGTPGWLLTCWSNFLQNLTRSFVVRDVCSQGLKSHTGYPEGCAMSCVAMAAVDLLLHAYQKAFTMRTKTLSFVDNIELVSSDPRQVVRGLVTLRTFCEALDLEVDEKKLYVWSSNAADRKTLKENNLRIHFSDRDLGGQMCYSKLKRVKVLTDRLEGLQIFFFKS